MLERVLEHEVMDGQDEALDYDTMDHDEVNRQFVDDLLAVCPVVGDVLDVGTGNALIPIELCQRVEDCRVMAADMSISMLELARYRIEVTGMIDCIQLDHTDAKEMHYQDKMFDVVLSNSIVHHIPDPTLVLTESLRVAKDDALIFFRDLLRPADQETLDKLVASHAGDANERQQKLFRESLLAALTLDEIRALVQQLGSDPDTVQATSDRHWTWCVRKTSLAAGENPRRTEEMNRGIPNKE